MHLTTKRITPNSGAACRRRPLDFFYEFLLRTSSITLTKSYSGWHRFNTKSATLVFSLILISFVVVTLKKYLAHAAQANLYESGAIEEISTHKAMKSGTRLFGNRLSPPLSGIHGLVKNAQNLNDRPLPFLQANHMFLLIIDR